MLKLKRLELENFGPFKAVQSLEFPESGVVIVYGDNMRGKTQLLNAVRYALYGKVLTRESRAQSLTQIENWEARREGIHGFRIKLTFDSGEHSYILTRQYHPREDVDVPESDYDYREEYFLQKEGVFLSPNERDRELARLIPEQISRFFLFDGELLQEYEELLRDDSEMGDRITNAIERILGVPVLTGARTHLRELHRSAQREAAKAAQRDQETEQLGNHHEQLGEERHYHEEIIAGLSEDLERKLSEKAALKQELDQTERARALLQELDDKQQRLDKIDDEIDKEFIRLQAQSTQLWKSVLAPGLRELQSDLQEKQQHLQQRITRLAVASYIEEAVQTGFCPVCQQQVEDDHVRSLREDLEQRQTAGSTNTSNRQLQTVTYRLNTLQQFIVSDEMSALNNIFASIEALQVEKYDIEDRVNELRESVSDFDESHVRAIYNDYEKIVKDIGLIEKSLSEEKEQVQKLDDQIASLEEKLAQSSGFSATRESRKSNLYDRLYQLFEEGVAAYRDWLREQVEADSSELFRSLTSEEQYARLSINQNYGLRIVHEDGEEIPIRSAGAEHIVALSLMGALQKNAPLRGPIVMDSPFGRLDETHTNNVVGSLPRMAEQVVLLVYRSELNAQRAREILGGNLKAEYRLDRVSARHTRLVPNVES